MIKFKDRCGEVINGRKIIRTVFNGHRNFYEVQCSSCNNVYLISFSNLLRTNKCSNCRDNKKIGPLNPVWRGGEYIPLDYFNSVKRNAIKRNIKFDISLEKCEELYLKQNCLCKFTGENINFYDRSASLDRINSSEGYNEQNIQWVHKDINKIKNKLSDSKFIEYCIKIHQYKHLPKIPHITPTCDLPNHKNFKGHGYIGKDLYTCLSRGARKRNLEFSVTIEELNELFLHQSGKCNLTGENLFFKIHRSNRTKNTSKLVLSGNVSLDRIDNSKGYITGNIQWVHKDINMLKYILPQDKLYDICSKITKKFTQVVAVSGYFQILHVGHVKLIEEARKLGGYLIVIVNSDKQALLKSTPAIVGEKQRAFIMSNIRGVDETIIAIDEDRTVAKTLELVKPDIFCNGGDRDAKTSSSKEIEICNKLGIKIVYGVGGDDKKDSSSSIMERAAKILNGKSLS